jgi:hypothetical protein
MLESRTISGEMLDKLKSILCPEIINEKLIPYGVSEKFRKFLDGADKVIFDRESLYAVARKPEAEDYELDFNVRGYIQLLGYFAAGLQRLDDEN